MKELNKSELEAVSGGSVHWHIHGGKVSGGGGTI